MEILVNQKGYSWKGGIGGVFQNSYGTPLEEAELLEARSGKGVARMTLGELETVPGWKGRFFQTLHYRGEVSPGRYRIGGLCRGQYCYSENFTVREELVREKDLSDLLIYFKGMRSDGDYDRADRQAPLWGTDQKVDVHGGWYDASGDSSKYLSHLSYAGRLSPQQTPLVVWVLGEVLEDYDRSSYWIGKNLRRWFRFELSYGADFLLRMQSPQGWFYKTLFDRWSKDPDQRVLSSFRGQDGQRLETVAAGFREGGGMACAALARAARLGTDEREGSYLEAAKKGYSQLKAEGKGYLEGEGENFLDHYCALLAAYELYSSTSEKRYLQEVEEYLGKILSSFTTFGEGEEGWWYSSGKIPYYHASDEGLPLIALHKALGILPEGGLKDSVGTMLDRAFHFFERTLLGHPNPFGYPRHWVKGENGRGLQWFYPHENPSGYWWQGENARLSSLGAAALMARPKGEEIAQSLWNWQLGVNPFGVSMVEGWGVQNPPYEGDYYNLPGGVVNGITSGFLDEEDIAFQPGEASEGDNTWRWGEQWLPHAAWFLLQAALLRKKTPFLEDQ